MAQLFIIEGNIDWAIYKIIDSSIHHQITRVLRMQTGDFLFLQERAWTKRVKVCIVHIDQKSITTELVTTESAPISLKQVTLYIALPNRFDKLEVIVQKLSEIWVYRCVFWPARKSILRELPQKKYERLTVIAREAIEQSWWWSVPIISFVDAIEFPSWGQIILFDYHENLSSHVPIHTVRERKSSSATHEIAGIVWPEWWFHNDELIARAPLLTAQIALGEHVLRMETAAIVGWWRLQQSI